MDLKRLVATFDDLLNNSPDLEARKRLKRGIEKASMRTHESMLSKLAERQGDTWRIRVSEGLPFRQA